MTTLTTAWMLGCVCGFFLGVTVASRRRPTCRGHNPPPPGRKPPAPPAPPYSSAAIALQAEDAQRIYRGAMWREKGSDVWQPLGEPIDFTELARQQLNRTTPPIKPQPSGGRMVDQSGMTIGYQPLPRPGRTITPPHTP